MGTHRIRSRSSPGRATWWLRCCSRGRLVCPARPTCLSCSRRRGRACRPCCSARTPSAARSSASHRRSLRSGPAQSPLPEAAPAHNTRRSKRRRSKWRRLGQRGRGGAAPERRRNRAQFRRREVAFPAPRPWTRSGAVPGRPARAQSPREGGGVAVTLWRRARRCGREGRAAPPPVLVRRESSREVPSPPCAWGNGAKLAADDTCLGVVRRRTLHSNHTVTSAHQHSRRSAHGGALGRRSAAPFCWPSSLAENGRGGESTRETALLA